MCLFWLFLHLLNEHLFTRRVVGVETVVIREEGPHAPTTDACSARGERENCCEHKLML